MALSRDCLIEAGTHSDQLPVENVAIVFFSPLSSNFRAVLLTNYYFFILIDNEYLNILNIDFKFGK